jgi:hypothetical protein
MLYQVAYCDSKFWKDDSLQNQVERTFQWYLLECPIIGIANLRIARERAKRKIKATFGPRAQVVIFGIENGQHVGVDADSILGITILQGANATECEAPAIVFGRGKKPVFYSRPEDLKIGEPC